MSLRCNVECAQDEGTSQEAALKAALGGEDESGSEQTEAEK